MGLTNKSFIVAAVLVASLGQRVLAQTPQDGIATHVDERVLAAESGSLPAANDRPRDLMGDALPLRLILFERKYAAPIATTSPAALRERPNGARWLTRAAFDLPPSPFGVRTTTTMPWRAAGLPRRFFAIPGVRWQGRAPLVISNGLVVVNPSIVIGRRLTCAPELVRGGRTVGVAVQVRVWVRQPPPSGTAAPAAGQTAETAILARVRDVLGIPR